MRKRLSKHFILATGMVVAMGALGATEAFANQARSRTSVSGSSQSRGGSSKSVATRGGGGGSRGAAVTRSGRSGRSGHRPSGRSHHGRHGHRSHRYGLSLGYYGYGWGGYLGYGGYFYHPYYYGYPVYYSYHPRRFEDFGGLDLNIRPKKTEVWVDGQYVGTAGRFDGYPGHLWLSAGPHELIFYKQGHETVVREVNVLEGVLVDVMLEMRAGEAIPAEQLTAFTQEELRRLREGQEYRAREEEPYEMDRPRVRERSADRSRRDDRRDVRQEPGRLTLEIEPVDASIYLDGRFLGTGDEVSRLHSGLIVAPGEHTLEVVRPGFASEEIPFSIDPGEEASLEVVLEGA